MPAEQAAGVSGDLLAALRRLPAGQREVVTLRAAIPSHDGQEISK